MVEPQLDHAAKFLAVLVEQLGKSSVITIAQASNEGCDLGVGFSGHRALLASIVKRQANACDDRLELEASHS
jgi:hypothetical protein